MSPLRSQCQRIINEYANYINLSNGRVLDVGIAGDPPPGENFKWFGNDNQYETLDIDGQYNPNFVGDICAAPFKDGEFDLVILSNTIEHIWNYKKAIDECMRISKKWVIIDCPFFYPYHAEDNFEDYWRLSKSALIKLIGEDKVVKSYQTQFLSSVLIKL